MLKLPHYEKIVETSVSDIISQVVYCQLVGETQILNTDTYTQEKSLWKPLLLVSSHKAQIANWQQENQIQVIKNNKRIHLLVQC